MSRRHEIGVGVLLVVATGVLAFMALQVGALRGLGRTIRVDAILDDVAGLDSGAVISVAGVSVGKVEGLAVEGARARITLSLDEEAQLRKDVVVAMRARSILGEKYLELRPQSADAPLLQDGDVLTVTRTQLQPDQLIDGLGPVLAALDPAALDAISRALKADPERVARMLVDMETIVRNGAAASAELPVLVSEARGAIMEARDLAAAGTEKLERLEGTIAKVEGLVEHADGLATSVDPVRVDRILAELEAGIEDGRVALESAKGAAADADQVLDQFKGVDWDSITRVVQEEGVFIRLSPYRRPAQEPSE
jgi:phospholipid/cholesterol/gamma-HCH transport system substrate-binding protein